MFSLNEVLENLQVEQLDHLLYRGTSLALPIKRVFGGQVLAQSLNAAARTVDSARRPHSLHAYFLRPGNPQQPIIYDVDPIRDGGSFTTRRVVARQNGKAIFNASCSFQVVEEGLEHQMAMPVDVPEPESLESDAERIERLINTATGSGNAFRFPADAIDIRSVNPRDPVNPTPADPVQSYWLRYRGVLDDNPVTHETLLAYVSDMNLMGTGLRPHPVDFMSENLQGASLDHAMWFHVDFRVDDWLFYHMDSPRAAHARGFNRGSFYTRDGVLVASCAQEGLMRLRR